MLRDALFSAKGQFHPATFDGGVYRERGVKKIPYLGVRVRVRPFWRSGRVPGSGFTRFWIPAQPPKTRIPKFTPMRFFQRFFGFPRRNSVKKVAPRRPAGAAALPGQVHKKPAKICPGACVFPLLCIVLSPTILEPEKTRFHRPENGRVPTRFCLHHGPFHTRPRRSRKPICP